MFIVYSLKYYNIVYTIDLLDLLDGIDYIYY